MLRIACLEVQAELQQPKDVSPRQDALIVGGRVPFEINMAGPVPPVYNEVNYFLWTSPVLSTKL